MNLYRIENNGIKVDISPIGASIVNFLVKDKHGLERNIVLGYDTEEEYKNNGPYIGAVVGPIANRVENGKFSIDGNSYFLTKNDGTNSLHGGDASFSEREWSIGKRNPNFISLSLNTEKGEGGYPSDIATEVTYHLDSEGSLSISYVSTPSSPCPINISHHAYFNLDDSGDVLGHEVWIDADAFLAVDESFIPYGVQTVNRTAFDFTTPRKISDALNVRPKDRQIEIVKGGFDHCYILNGKEESAWVRSEETGIKLLVKTDLPGVQFYTGNSLSEQKGRNGRIYNKHSGFCLETQFFPNQINTDKRNESIFSPYSPLKTTTVYSIEVQ